MADAVADPPAPAQGRTRGGRTRAGRRWALPEPLARLLELLVLTGFAVAQPLLDVTGRSPESFVYWRAGPLDIVAFVLVVTVVPAAVLWGLEQLAGLAGDRVRRVVHHVVVGLLLSAIAVQVAKRIGPERGWLLLLWALTAGAVGAVLLARSGTARTFVRYLTPAPLAFALLFLFASPTGGLVTDAAASQGSVASAAVGRTPPLVVLFFDELPAVNLIGPDGGIDERVYPHLARLQQESTWFRQATGVSGFTPYALPAMLSGRYPEEDLAPSYLNYPDTLFTLLADAYEVRAAETISELCPPDVCTGPSSARATTGVLPVLRESAGVAAQILSPFDATGDPMEQFVEAADDGAGEEEAGAEDARRRGRELDVRFRFDTLLGDQPERLTTFLDELRPADRPTLHFLHLLLPHAPHRYLPSGARYERAEPWLDETGRRTDRDHLGAEMIVRQRHLLQLAYTDRIVGEVVRTLEERGMYDESLLVVTADHGVSYAPPWPLRQLSPGTAHELAYVPVLVKAPGQERGVVDDRNFEQVDLLPTIADLLDVEIPWDVDGVSGVGPPGRTREEKYFYDEAGTRLTFSGRDAGARLLEGMLGRWARPEDGAEGLYAFGPYRDLVGRELGTLPVGPPSALRAVVNRGPVVELDDTPGALVPAMLWGVVPGAESGTPVAVAVNGVIGAVPLLHTDPETGDPLLTAMVSDRLFSPGENDLELFVVEDGADGTVLHPLALEQADSP